VAEREAGRHVRLPPGAERPISVFVNGVEKKEGIDYSAHGSEIEFSEPLIKEEVSRARWLIMLLGLFGSYGRNDVVDLHYRQGGETKVVSDAEIVR
jgi:hypothetical protein